MEDHHAVVPIREDFGRMSLSAWCSRSSDPADMRWVFVSHADRDHTGNVGR
jgi:flavorubredoxin